MTTVQSELPMTTIAIVSHEGGCGKTTAAVNLTVEAHYAHLCALVVDLDPQRGASQWRQARPSDSIEVLTATSDALGQVLGEARGRGVKLVVIDTGAGPESAPRSAVAVADVVLVPFSVHAFGTEKAERTVRQCEAYGKVPLVVLTQTDPDGSKAREARATLAQLGMDVLATTLASSESFVASMRRGPGVGEHGDEIAARAVRALLAELLGSSAARGRVGSKVRFNRPRAAHPDEDCSSCGGDVPYATRTD